MAVYLENTFLIVFFVDSLVVVMTFRHKVMKNKVEKRISPWKCVGCSQTLDSTIGIFILLSMEKMSHRRQIFLELRNIVLLIGGNSLMAPHWTTQTGNENDVTGNLRHLGHQVRRIFFWSGVSLDKFIVFYDGFLNQKAIL